MGDRKRNENDAGGTVGKEQSYTTKVKNEWKWKMKGMETMGKIEGMDDISLCQESHESDNMEADVFCLKLEFTSY